MDVHYSSQFKKQYKKLPKKTQVQFKKRLILFTIDQRHTQLHVHKLTGRYDDLWSIKVTGNIRAVFDKNFEETVLFMAIGSHGTLYS